MMKEENELLKEQLKKAEKKKDVNS